MIKHKTRLEARVAAQNKVNAEAIRLQHELTKFFEPYVGQKVLSVVDNSFLKKIKSQIDAILDNGQKRSGCRSYISGYRDYTLSVQVQGWEQYDRADDWTGRDGQMNVEAIVNFATMENAGVCEPKTGKIKKICDVNYNLRTDYTAAEVLANRADYKEKNAIAEASKSKLAPFGEYDR